MSDFNASTSENSTELEDAQSSYRTIVSLLNAAQRQGNKTRARELKRSKDRISKRIDTLKSQGQPVQF